MQALQDKDAAVSDAQGQCINWMLGSQECIGLCLSVVRRYSCFTGAMSKLRHTAEEQQKALEAVAGMNQQSAICVMCDVGCRRSATPGKTCSAC